MKKAITGILSAVMAAVLLTTTASGAENFNSEVQEDMPAGSHGSYRKDAITGEVEYIPPLESTYSFNEPDSLFEHDLSFENVDFASDDEINQSINPLDYDYNHTGKLISNPSSDEICRKTVLIEATTTSYGKQKFTGFMIGPNAVATCGHCVYNKKYGGDNWVTATVTPARSTFSPRMPYGSANAIAYECGYEWTQTEKLSDDWGIIILDSNIGDKTGWLQSEKKGIFTSYKNKDAWVNGYPEDSYDMFQHTGKVTEVRDGYLICRYIITAEGDSGAPCIIKKSKGYIVIGFVQSCNQKEHGSRYVEISDWLSNKYDSFQTSTL